MVRKTIAEASQNLRQASNEKINRVYLQEADGYYYYDDGYYAAPFIGFSFGGRGGFRGHRGHGHRR